MTEAREISGRGAMAWADADALRRGLATIRDNCVLGLGLEIRNGEGPVGPRRPVPQRFMMRDGGDAAIGPEECGFSFSDDIVLLATHGTTHLDALCHVWSHGKLYGDLSADLVTSRGAKRLGIDEAGPLATRVLIVDAVPDGRPWLEASEPAPLALIRERLERAGLTPARGDALFIKTGWIDAWRAGAQDNKSWGGLDVDAIEWILESGFCVLGADNIAVEMSPSSDPSCAVPLHVELLRGHGIFFCELLDLSFLAQPAVGAFLSMAPLRIVGGTAGPVSPVVIL